jgi:hypothetical protein
MFLFADSADKCREQEAYCKARRTRNLQWINLKESDQAFAKRDEIDSGFITLSRS